MTRWLLIVLMVLLPAQFSWAAAAPYCAHESNPVSFHVGHHTHVHEGTASAEAQYSASEQGTQKSERLPVSDHSDCHYCHAVAVQLAAPAALQFEPPERHVLLAVVTTRLDDARPSRIERPKWARAA